MRGCKGGGGKGREMSLFVFLNALNNFESGLSMGGQRSQFCPHPKVAKEAMSDVDATIPYDVVSSSSNNPLSSVMNLLYV